MADNDQSDKAKKWNALHEQAQKEWPKDEAAESEEIEITEESAEQPQETQGVLEHPSYKKLEDELTAMEQKMHDYWNQTLRARAEVENIQARAEKDITNARKFALEKFAIELLQVADSLDQGLQIETNDNELAKSIHKGLELTDALMHQVLEKFGVESIGALGEKFDPSQHEAISMQDGEGAQSNTVIKVMQKGYTLNGRVIRPAMVIVAK